MGFASIAACAAKIKPGAITAAALMAAIVLAGPGCSRSESPVVTDPDIIIFNAKVVTMDAKDSVAGALAITGDTITAVGGSAEIRRLAGPATELIDARGNSVTPGIIDTHNHFAWSVSSNLAQLDLEFPAVSNILDVRRQLERAVAEAEAGEWIFGWRWDAQKLEEQRDIVAADLDDLSPDNPVWLGHTSGHYGVANSRALQIAGIGAGTPDPDGGVIVRDKDGNPTGVLTDQAMDLIDRVRPDATTEDYIEAVTRFAGDLSAEGITTIKDPEINQLHWDAYQAVEASGELPVRVFALWRAPDTMAGARELLERIAPLTDPRAQDGDRLVVSGGVKIYIDGSGTARTAWMYEDWNEEFTGTDEGNRGLTYLEPTVLFDQIRLFHDAGIHIGTHAIGDRAIDFTMDAYDHVLADKPTPSMRHSIIHCNLPTAHAMDLMVKLQREYDAGYPEVQPAFLWWIGDVYVANFGPERSRRVLPLRTFEDRGIRWAGSSDFDVSPYALRHALWGATTREPMLGTWGEEPWGTAERISVHETLRAYTVTASRQVFLEDRIGTIEAGKLADVVTWDRDLYAVPVGELHEVRAAMTIMNGSVVFREDGR